MKASRLFLKIFIKFTVLVFIVFITLMWVRIYNLHKYLYVYMYSNIFIWYIFAKFLISASKKSRKSACYFIWFLTRERSYHNLLVSSDIFVKIRIHLWLPVICCCYSHVAACMLICFVPIQHLFEEVFNKDAQRM